jgi:hypothetical protein
MVSLSDTDRYEKFSTYIIPQLIYGGKFMTLTLLEALAFYPWRLLRLMARRHGVPVPSTIPKSGLINHLIAILSEPTTLRQSRQNLSDPARQALSDLLSVEAPLALRHLRLHYGLCRPITQLHQPHPSDDRPPLEELLLSGLAFYHRRHEHFFIPIDLRPLLIDASDLGREQQATDQRQPSDTGQAIEGLAHDLTCFLALLQRQPPRLLHGRWLPASALKQWAAWCIIPPEWPNSRSERQTQRRRFLHYLAEQAGLVAVEAMHLSLTPAGWLWLQTEAAERFQILWQSWRTPDPRQWIAFQLPGALWLPNPRPLLEIIHQSLAEEVMTSQPLYPADYARTLLLRYPILHDFVPANLYEPVALLTDTIAQILLGPLTWLGLLAPVDAPSFGPEKTAGAREQQTQNQLKLTAWGRYWLGSADQPPLLPATRYSLTSNVEPDPLKSRLQLELSEALPDPEQLGIALILSESSEVAPGPRPGLRGDAPPNSHRHTITPISFSHALRQGWSPPQIIDALQRLANRALSGQELALLRTWAEAAGRVTIHPLPILETTDPGVISRLAATRRGRAHIVRTLSPRAVVVDGFRVEPLVRRLTEQEGVPPRVVAGSREYEVRSREDVVGRKDSHSATQDSPPSPPEGGASIPPAGGLGGLEGPAAAAHLWLAMRVYHELGQHIDLPVRLPYALRDKVAEQLDEASLAAAEAAVEQTLAALKEALIGRVAFPPWPDEGLPVEETLPLIEQALATGQALELDYYALSTDTVTRRVVEPYRVEWRGRGAGEQRSEGVGGHGEGKDGGMGGGERRGVPYLVGFCHRAQAERVFRLDRIRRIITL